MAISCDQRLSTPTGPARADETAPGAPQRRWRRLSAGPGSKGQRPDDWLLIDPGADTHQVLVRRSISKPAELAYYIIHTSTPVPIAELARVAGSRWAVEETFHAWYRHITLSMFAAAFLAVTACHERQHNDQKGAHPPTATS